jgi:type II secretory pathway pseudopilin PulG
LTLVEVALLLCIAGIILAVAVPAFVKNVRTSKLTEVSVQLDALHRAAAAYYQASRRLPEGTRKHCLPPAAGPAPEKPSPEPVEVDFASPDTPGAESWRALGFDPAEPLRFRYTFLPARAGCGLQPSGNRPMLLLRAEGDLDGDGEYSTFERSSVVSENGELVPTRLLVVKDRME